MAESQKKFRTVDFVFAVRERVRVAMGDKRPTELARLTEFPDSTVHRYLKDMEPSAPFLAAVCIALGLSADWLLLGRGPMKAGETDLSKVEFHELLMEQSRRWVSLTGEVARLVRLLDRKAAEEKREAFLEEVPADRVPSRQDWHRFYVPIISAVAAGLGAGTEKADSYPPGAAESYAHYEGAPPRSFAVRVEGESMEPEFKNGDVVIVDPDARPMAGKPAIAVVEDVATHLPKAYLKIWRQRGKMIRLESLSPEYSVIEVNPKAVLHAWPVRKHLKRAT